MDIGEHIEHHVIIKEPVSTSKIPVIKTIIYISMIIFLEQCKYVEGQPLIDTLINAYFFSTLFIVTGAIRNIIGSLVLDFEIFETISYHYSHAGINQQIIMSLDFGVAWKNMKIVYFIVLLAVVFILIIMHIAIFDQYELNISYTIKFMMIVTIGISFFVIFKRLDRNLNGSNESIINRQYSNSTILNFFRQNVTTKPRSKKPLKNLLIFEMESMEVQMLGRFNPLIPKSLPYITKLTKNSTFFSNMVPQEYTTWSVASTFALHCGMPMIIPYSNIDPNGQRTHLSKEHHCIGDYLHQAGYKLYSMMTKVFCGNFKKMMQLHHWIAKDQKDHKFDHDYDVLQLIMNDMLPQLAKDPQPFALHIATTDTHPVYPSLHKKCKLRVPPNYMITLKEFDCYDQVMEEFFNKFEQLGLHKNTVVIIYGDHPMMWLNGLKVVEPRYLPIIIPYREVIEINRSISIYDLSHTIFDLLELDFSPKFPFGASLFRKTQGTVPKQDDFRFLFSLFRNTFIVFNETTQPLNETFIE